MKKNEIIKAVSDELGMTIKETAAVVDTFIDYTELALQNGDCVYIPKLGKLSVEQRQARMARNPQNGEKMEVPAKKVIKFKASKTLKDAINGEE